MQYFEPLPRWLSGWEGSTKDKPGDLPLFILSNFRDKGFVMKQLYIIISSIFLCCATSLYAQLDSIQELDEVLLSDTKLNDFSEGYKLLKLSDSIAQNNSSLTDIQKSPPLVLDTKPELEVNYAHGFEIKYLNSYKVITLKNPWPGADVVFKYALVEENAVLPTSEKFDAIIKIPVSRIVVTSTTHIPSLEMLRASEALVGFPNLNYISSETTRKRIDDGKIIELGKNEDMNTEVLIDLSPDLVVGFAVDGNNSALSIIHSAFPKGVVSVQSEL